jgi:hypothetical protein
MKNGGINMKSFFQRTFEASAGICVKLDSDIEKNMVKFHKSAADFRTGSLSRKASAFFTGGASIKIAAGEKILSAPFLVLREVSARLK